MADYRLSLRARADLISIYAFTEARFGRYQAEAYHAGFDLLAEFPVLESQRMNLLQVTAASASSRTTSSTPKKPIMC